MTSLTAWYRDLAVSSAIRVPFSTAFNEFSIKAEVSFEASALLLARLRTSSATTAKPFPAVPARAASTAALRARILVWKAISSIVLIIFPISFEQLVISSIACIIWCIFSLLTFISVLMLPAFSLAFCALSAFCFILLEISLMVEASSCTELACSVAPWESAWEPLATCWEPLATCVELWLICCMVSLSLSAMPRKETSKGWKPPVYSASQTESTVKSPSAIFARNLFSSSMITCSLWINRRTCAARMPSSSLEV